MSKRIGIEVSIALADAVGLCDVDVVAAYPITPQTHIVEHLAELVAEGHLDADFVPVESEHSAMSACIGSSAAGARTFTSTCSQGYALMSELCYIASAMRLPIVMAVANRAISAPINIWNDHADLMTQGIPNGFSSSPKTARRQLTCPFWPSVLLKIKEYPCLCR